MTLRLHWSPDSANLVVRIALETLALPFEGVRINRAAGDHKRPEYLALNPQGLIPVLQDGDLVLFETGAILWHVAERAGRLGPDGPLMDDPAARAAALRWVFYLSNTVHADLRVAFYADRYLDDAAAVPSLRRGIARRLRGHGALMEAQLAKTGGLIGPSVTVADIYLAVCLRWAQLYPAGAPLLAGLAEWPRLHALGARIEGLAGARRAFAAEMIPADRALTAPQPPNLPRDQITGVV
ncbi:MAG: glutathione S-transferase family protein [Alphaproteobacteria bacterium]|nr:glutathione S-transferase family protein [Alphaproteobacteria bacterium]